MIPGHCMKPKGGLTDLGVLGWFAGQWGRFFLPGRVEPKNHPTPPRSLNHRRTDDITESIGASY